MEAIVLAGGFGTRLKHIVSDVPKPMAPISGRPFLRYVLDELTDKGIDRIILAVGYMKEKIIEYFGDFYRGARLCYSSEDTPLLTGGAVKKALKLCQEDFVFIVNGDTLFKADLSAMASFRSQKQASFVMAVHSMQNFDRYGTVAINSNGCISAFKEKYFTEQGIINAGVYLMSRDFLQNIECESFSLEKDVLEKQTGMNSLYAFPSDGYFIDIGIPEDYAKAQRELPAFPIELKAVFFDRDGTINENIGYLHKPEDLRFKEGMPEFIARWNQWGYKVIVLTNQAGIARGYYTEDDMRNLHRYMNEQLKTYQAHIDAFYFCPHHPDFTGHCHCRKPEPGMLEKALADFELYPAQCLLFGDQPWDMDVAEKCGVMGIKINN